MHFPATLLSFLFMISLSYSKVSWKTALSKLAFSVVPVSFLIAVQTAQAEGIMDASSRSQAPVYRTLPSGVRYLDVTIGSGDKPVEVGRTVHFLWSLRQGNGYFVDSSSSADNDEFIYKVGNTKGTKAINGIDEGICGMKIGGIRRIDVPPKMGYVEGVGEGKPGPIPAGYGPRRQILTHADRDTFHFEVKVTKIK